MTGKTAPMPDETADARPGRPTPPGPERAALALGLGQIREALFRRLDRIEALAREQAAAGNEPGEREQALRERVAALEALQARLQAEARRREQEWQELTRQLESDRRLLAESWERLEQEQLDAPRGHDGHPPRAEAALPAPPPALRPPQDDDPDDPVTRAILRQFQAMKTDVRRNAKGRNVR